MTTHREIHAGSLTGSAVAIVSTNYVFIEQQILCTTNQDRSIQYIDLGRTNNSIVLKFNLTFPRTKERIKHMKETLSVIFQMR